MDRETYSGQPRRLTPEERAAKVKKLKRKRRIRLAIVITAFTLLVAAIVSPIILFAAFRVKNFVVEGKSPYTKEQIIEASEIGTGKSLIFADIDEAKAAIEKNLPYTVDVEITKKLPSSLIIRYGETAKAFAIQLAGGTYAVTDSSLKVLELSSDVPEDVFLIKGATPVNSETGTILSFLKKEDEKKQASDVTLSLIFEITKAITENSLKDVNLIDVASRNNIYVIYQERIVLRLGDSNNIASKLSLGQRVIEEEGQIDPSLTGIIDLTIDGKAYVKPADIDDIKELVIYSGGEWKNENSLVDNDDSKSDENSDEEENSETEDGEEDTQRNENSEDEE